MTNVGDKGERLPTHADFLRAYLPRAAAKLGSAPTTILCNPADVDAVKAAFAGLTIDTRATIPPCNFWIGAGNGATHHTEEGGETA